MKRLQIVTSCKLERSVITKDKASDYLIEKKEE